MAASEPLAQARLVARAPAGGGMTLLDLEPPAETHVSYTHPGQYVSVEVAGESGYFVLAGALGAAVWQLLVRNGGVADRLLAAPIGQAIAISRASGHGFPNDVARGEPLVVAVAGTGIAAARAVVPPRIASGDAKATFVLAGFRTRADVPLWTELVEWMRAGVSVTVCLSREHAERVEDGVRIAAGRVHEVLRASGRHAGPLFVAGPDGLLESLRTAAPEVGFRPEDVHTNV